MTATFAALSTYDPLLRSAIEIGLTSLVRVALPLAVGLLVLRAMGRNAAEARRIVANASLASAAAVLILSIICVAVPTSLPALWSIQLPESHSLTSYSSSAHPLASGSLDSHPLAGHFRFPLKAPDPLGGWLSRASTFSRPSPVASSTIVPVRSPLGTVTSSPVEALSTAPPRQGHFGIAESDPAVAAVSGSMVDHGTPVRSASLPGFATLTVAATLCWLTGVTALLAWLVFSACSIAWRLRHGQNVEQDETVAALDDLCARTGVCPPRLIACAKVRSPFVAGLVRPTLVLPDSYQTDFAPEALRAILAHEVMHLAQRDCLWTLLSRILCALCWPLPLVWALTRQREALSEEACDAAVLNEGCSPTVYARCLLSLAERLRPLRPERVAGVGALTARSSLSRRIERILAGPCTNHPPMPRFGRLALAAAAIVVTLPCMVLVGQAAPKGARGPGQEVEPAQSNSATGSRSGEQTSPGQTPTKHDTQATDALTRADAANQAEEHDSDTKRISRWYELAKGALAKQTEAHYRARAAAEVVARNMQQAERQRIRAQLLGLGAALKVIEARRESVTATLNSIGPSNDRKRRVLREEKVRIVQTQRHLLGVVQGMQRHADAIAGLQAAALQAEVDEKRAELAAQHARLLAAGAGLAQAETALQSARAKYTDVAPQVRQAQAAIQQAEANVVAQAEQQARLLQKSSARRSTADQLDIDALEHTAWADVTVQRVRTEAAEAALAQAQSLLQSTRADYTDSAPQLQQADAALRRARANLASQQAQLATDQAAEFAAQKRAVEALRSARANLASQRVGPEKDRADADQAAAVAATKRAVDALRQARANVASQQAQLAADQAAAVTAQKRAVEALRKALANVASQQARLAASQAAVLADQKRAVEALRKAQDGAGKRKAPIDSAH